MDSKTSAPETTTSQDSYSSGSSSSPASSSHDSSIDNSIKDHALEADNNKTTNSSSTGGSSDGGFVSVEEFETAPEGPSVIDLDVKTPDERVGVDAYESPFEGSLESSMPKSVLPIEKVSVDVDDDDGIVEDSKVRALKEDESFGDVDKVMKEFGGESSVDELEIGGVNFGGKEASVETGSNGNVNLGKIELEKVEVGGNELKDGEGVEGLKSEVSNGEKSSIVVETKEASGVVENDSIPGVGTEQEEYGVVGPADDKLAEGEGLKFTNGGDSVVDSIHVDLLASGAAAVGDVEENKETEVKGMEVPVDGSVSLDNGFDHINRDVEEPVDSNAVCDKDVDLVATNNGETAEVEPNGQKIDVVVKDNNSDAGGVSSDSVANDTQVGEEMEANVDVSGNVSLGNKEEKPIAKVVEVEADREAKVETAADMAEVLPSEKVDGESGDATQSADIVAESTQTAADATKFVSTDKMDGEGGDATHTVGIVAKPTQATADAAEHVGVEGIDAARSVSFVAESTQATADVVEVVSSDNLDVEGGDATQSVDIVTESTQPTAASEPGHVESDRTYVTAQKEKSEDFGVSSESHSPEVVKPSAVSRREFGVEAEDEEDQHPDEEGEIEGSVTDEETDGIVFGSSEAAKQFLEELEQGSGVGSHSGAESSHDRSQRIDGQIVTDSDEEVDTDEEGEGKELFDSAALAALLKAATGADSDGGSITITSQDGSRLFSVERPAGLGSSLRSVKPTPRSTRPNLFTHSNLTTGGDPENNLSEEERKKLEKLQQVRVKFLRLVQRLGHSAEDSVAAQVLYRLALVAGRQTSQLFSLDAARRAALQLEAEGKDDLDFSLNILVLGKTGVGKSATINSIFGEEKAVIHAFEPGTSAVREITGTVDGVKIRIIDTPGLKSSAMDQCANRKVLSSIKKLTKKCPPDIVLYVDRLDTQTRDLNDLPLLRTITSSLGSSIWRNAIVTLTHSASAPPDGPSGSPLSYEVFVAQRSHVVQQSIGQAVGDLRLMNPSLMNPVSLVENHPSCRKNRDGQKVLPNGQSWRPQLLLLCYSMKILSESSSLSKPQDPFDHRKLFGFRVRSPPLPYLLSWLLQSRTHPKLSADQGGDNGDSDIDLDDLSDSDQEEEEDEYDQLPPFKPLRKGQLAKLSNEQRKAYFEEYDYRVKLLQKKQWREELRRMREIKKKGKVASDEYGYMEEDIDQENGAPAAVPVPLPDMALPPSFDSDNPAYRYRFLEPTSQFLARPVLDTHGWDHDCGYDGVNVEQSLAIASRFPAVVAVQVTKDKKEFNIHLDSSISAKYGENGSTMAGFDIQNVGKQLAYIVRGETKFKNFKKNKTAAGVSVTFLGENVATGVKLEDQIALGKRLVLVGSTGTVRSQGDSAYGANLEVRLREADFPIGQDQSSLGLSLVKWRGDLALGANLQSQFSIGRSSKIAVRAGLNNKLSGQITVRTSSSDQLQLALVGIVPVAMAIYKLFHPGVSENHSMY